MSAKKDPAERLREILEVLNTCNGNCHGTLEKLRKHVSKFGIPDYLFDGVCTALGTIASASLACEQQDKARYLLRQIRKNGGNNVTI